MQIHKTDYDYLHDRLAHLGAFLTVALASAETSPYASTAEVHRDEAWYDRQKSYHPSSTPHDLANLRPLMVALFRQLMWQESPSRLEAEIDEARDAALSSAMSLCGLRDRISRHLAENRQKLEAKP